MWLDTCTLFILLSWSLELRGIREIMQIPSCSSNSHLAPPLLRLRVLPFGSISPLPLQESLSSSSPQLIFPRTQPIPVSMIQDSWPIFPLCIMDLCIHPASSFKGNMSVREGSFYPAEKQPPKKNKNTNKWKRRVVCVRIKSTDVNPLGFCMCIISTFDCTTQ